jgi:acyl dehydratase
MKVGDVLSTACSFTTEDVQTFARLSGDDASHHQEPDAQGRLVVHGLLTASLPTRLGSTMNIWAREMTCMWHRPVFTDEAITCEVTIESMRATEHGTQMSVSLRCFNAARDDVLTGECRGTSPLSMDELQARPLPMVD